MCLYVGKNSLFQTQEIQKCILTSVGSSDFKQVAMMLAFKIFNEMLTLAMRIAGGIEVGFFVGKLIVFSLEWLISILQFPQCLLESFIFQIYKIRWNLLEC